MDKTEECAKKALQKIGITKGQIILDCCCGSGTYTLPAAEITGKEGLVYAIDRNPSKLSELKKRESDKKVDNIEIIERDVESQIPLPDHTIDVTFLFDIFWYFRPTHNDLQSLLREINRVAKKNALVVVYPTHLSSQELHQFKDQMNDAGFRFEKEYSGTLVHEDSLEQGKLLRFRKVQ
jgi:ubiquinone/menaquinone biosynthesis C-methylase UbiE